MNDMEIVNILDIETSKHICPQCRAKMSTLMLTDDCRVLMICNNYRADDDEPHVLTTMRDITESEKPMVVMHRLKKADEGRA